jgi:formate/nitrite transporter FocA (FNT family)
MSKNTPPDEDDRSIDEQAADHVLKLAAIRLQRLAVVFVGIVAVLLVVGAIFISLLAPTQAERIWPIIVPLLMTAITTLIWWSAQRGK